MALANAVEGARHVPQRITWSDTDGDPVDLTDATLSGRIRDEAGVARAIDGELTIVTAASGIFDWDYGALDVGDPGVFEVQFTATYGVADLDRTLHETWMVTEAL